VLVASADPDRHHAAPCMDGGANFVVYCGPAIARLAVFPGVVFRNGSCRHKLVSGVRLLQLRLGARSLDGSPTNRGRTYLSLGFSGSRARREVGTVLAYFRSRRWIGRGVSFAGDANGGWFVVRAAGSSSGTTEGMFRCS
jgi:hypothetical protein